MTGGSGCTPRTVRYYERQGLLRAARSAGGHRLFDEAELERLNFIVGLREAGWSLEEVQAVLQVRDDAEHDHEAVSKLDRLLSSHIERLEAKIALLSELRADLGRTLALLSVCGECTSKAERIECDTCERVPPRAALPRGFRLAWRSRDRIGLPPFDDAAGDGDGDGDGEDV